MPEIEVNGRSISFRDEGSGPPVLLLHCSSSHSGQWKPWMAHLSKVARVLAPDFHGYGRSDGLPEGMVWWQAKSFALPRSPFLLTAHLCGLPSTASRLRTATGNGQEQAKENPNNDRV